MKIRIKKPLQKLLRQTGFLTISLVLRLPLWILLFLVRPGKSVGYLFVIYPGHKKDVIEFCPKWLAYSPIFMGRPTIGGMISNGTAKRGLVLVVPNTVGEMRADKKMCQAIQRRLLRVQRLTGARAIALAGQMPGVFLRHGLELEKPFVTGVRGTVYSVVETIETLTAQKIAPASGTMVIVGVGHMGGEVIDYLQDRSWKIHGIDIRRHRDGVLLPEEGEKVLAQADMVVVLTPKGSDFAPYMKYLKPGCLVVDDTHPRLHATISGLKLYKVAIGLPGTIFYPRLPGYRRDWLPGCVVEAIYAAVTSSFGSDPLPVFIERARQLGYYAHLDR